MEIEFTERRKRRLLTSPNNFRDISKQLLLNLPVNKIEENELETSVVSVNENKKENLELNKEQTSTSLLKLKFETPIKIDTIYSNASTTETIRYPKIKRHSVQTRMPTKKTQKTILQPSSTSIIFYLDFNELKPRMDKVNKNISDESFRQAEVIKLETLYRNSLISLIKDIDNKIEEREKIKAEITMLQTKITQAKLKMEEILANFKIFQQAAQKQCSTVMFTRFCAEKDRVSRLISRIKEKQDEHKSSLTIKKEQEYELSIKLKELKSLKVKNSNVLAEYYNRLLEEAKDLRNEGLTWILYKLLELGWNLDKCHFPSLLTKRQINFLITYSKKRIELTQLKIIYEAIKKKYSLRPSRNVLNTRTVKIDTSLGKNQSQTIQQFFNSYYNNKNSSAYIGLSVSGKGNLKIIDFLAELDSKVNTDREINDNPQSRNHFCLSINKETVDNISEIKNQIEKIKKEITALIETEIKVYQSENDDIKILNYSQYERIYHVLFGKYITTLSK